MRHPFLRAVGGRSDAGGVLVVVRREAPGHGGQTPCVVGPGFHQFQQVAGAITTAALGIERVGERQTGFAEGLQRLVEFMGLAYQARRGVGAQAPRRRVQEASEDQQEVDQFLVAGPADREGQHDYGG